MTSGLEKANEEPFLVGRECIWPDVREELGLSAFVRWMRACEVWGHVFGSRVVSASENALVIAILNKKWNLNLGQGILQSAGFSTGRTAAVIFVVLPHL